MRYAIRRLSLVRALAERSRGDAVPVYVRGPGSSSPAPDPASVGGLWYPSLTTAFLARRRIDFAAGLHWLHYHGIASAIACRTFMLSRFSGWLFHIQSLGRLSWRPLSCPALASSQAARSRVVPSEFGRRNVTRPARRRTVDASRPLRRAARQRWRVSMPLVPNYSRG